MATGLVTQASGDLEQCSFSEVVGSSGLGRNWEVRLWRQVQLTLVRIFAVKGAERQGGPQKNGG